MLQDKSSLNLEKRISRKVAEPQNLETSRRIHIKSTRTVQINIIAFADSY